MRFAAGPRQPQDLSNLVAHAGRMLLLHDWHRLLSDQRNMLGMTLEEKKWIVLYWNTGNVVRPSRIVSAVVVPTEVMARMASRQIWNEVPLTYLEYHSFDTLEPAHNFLDELATELW